MPKMEADTMVSTGGPSLLRGGFIGAGVDGGDCGGCGDGAGVLGGSGACGGGGEGDKNSALAGHAAGSSAWSAPEKPFGM